MTLPAPFFVTSREALASCVARCLDCDAVTVDTEFIRTDTFFPVLGLIQISDGCDVWLIDPLAIDDFAELERLFLAPAVVKVFHSCSEDLEVLRHQLGLVPAPLFDTQVAAAFLNYGYSRGYAAMAQTVLDLALDQQETRSDWLRRPLTDSQQKYAAEDVYYLMQIYRKLVGELEVAGRSEWVRAEMAELLANARAPESLETYYLRVKGANKLDQRDTALLRELTCWREREARARNRPRNRIVADRALLDLIRFKPEKTNGLYRIEGFNAGTVHRYGEMLLELVHSEPELDDLEAIPEPLDKKGKALMAQCRDLLEAAARKMTLAVELLARKKELESLVSSALAGKPELPIRLVDSWRYEICGRELLALVAAEGKCHD